METILFLAFTEADGSLAKGALEALAAAKELPGTLIAGLIGENVSGCDASRVLAVAGTEYAQPRYATDAAAVEALVRASGASIVIAPSNSRTARVLPGVSHRVNGRADTHVTDITPDLTITRWYYRQRIEGVLKHSHRPWILLLEAGIRPAWTGATAGKEIERITVAPVATRTSVAGVQVPRIDQETIRPDADLLFVAGAGWTKMQRDGAAHLDDAARLILEFINSANASLGSSKSLVDISGEGQQVLPFLTHLNQVGQTGSTPRHAKGLATCCHGEEPHVVGWRFIRERRAVNLDPNCGWARGKADIVYVADAFEVMEKVNALLR
jgi:electron transfer flavoprotein alpha subunit